MSAMAVFFADGRGDLHVPKFLDRYACLSDRFAAALALLLALGGCIAGPAPMIAPEEAARQVRDEEFLVNTYDMNSDGATEYGERLDDAGRIDRLYFDDDQDGTWDERIALNDVPPAERRHLVIILDSVPFDMVKAAWHEGRFRYFPPPTRIVAPFPVMTDVSLAEFFSCSPCPGVESEYFDGTKLTSGYATYAEGGNTPWLSFVDYWLSPLQHPAAYLDGRHWFDHELRRIQEIYRDRTEVLTVGYVVSTSALGARVGRQGHEQGLRRLDRYCRRMIYETHGRIRLTLMSDHGHHFADARRIALDEELRTRGYCVGTHLRDSRDAVVPEYGMVSYAGVYALDPPAVARDLREVEGVDVVACMEADGRLLVLGREGEAFIEPADDGFRYSPTRGDPLHLITGRHNSDTQGAMPDNPVLSNAEALERVPEQNYPDAMHRLWRAFHGLVQHPPHVLVSMEDGYYCGSGTMSSLFNIVGVHGNLKPDSTFGFAMTMLGPLPQTLRMEDLRNAMIAQGLPEPRPK